MLSSTATIGWLTAAHWKGHATSNNSSKRDFFSVKPDCIGAFVIANSRIFAFRTAAFKPFLFSLNCRFETFSSYNPCRNNKLGRERGLVSNGVVGEVREFNSIANLSFPANFAGVVVSKLILFKRFKKYLFLVFGSFKDKFKSSLKFHIHTLLQYLQIFKCGLLPVLKNRLSDRKGGVYEYERDKIIYFFHFGSYYHYIYY